MQHSPLSYLNGNYIPFSELKLPVYDLGIVQGATVTERLRTFQQIPFLVAEHLARLCTSLAAIGLNASLADSLDAVIEKLVNANARLLAEGEELAVVLFVTAGHLIGDSNGLANTSTPSVCAYTTPLSNMKYQTGYKNGVHVIVSSIRQIPAECISPQIKMRSRLHWYLADQEVRSQDPDAMAILLDQSGQLTETSSGNLFVVKDGNLFTPPKEFTLLGISQDYVIKLGNEMGITTAHTALLPEDLLNCDEAFLSSSTYCILPVTRFNSQIIGNGQPGEVTRRMITRWEKCVGTKFTNPPDIRHL